MFKCCSCSRRRLLTRSFIRHVCARCFVPTIASLCLFFMKHSGSCQSIISPSSSSQPFSSLSNASKGITEAILPVYIVIHLEKWIKNQTISPGFWLVVKRVMIWTSLRMSLFLFTSREDPVTAGHGRDFSSNQNNFRSKSLCNDELLWELVSTKSLKIELQHDE